MGIPFQIPGSSESLPTRVELIYPIEGRRYYEGFQNGIVAEAWEYVYMRLRGWNLRGVGLTLAPNLIPLKGPGCQCESTCTSLAFLLKPRLQKFYTRKGRCKSREAALLSWGFSYCMVWCKAKRVKRSPLLASSDSRLRVRGGLVGPLN